jgi:hypothetical protein
MDSAMSEDKETNSCSRWPIRYVPLRNIHEQGAV